MVASLCQNAIFFEIQENILFCIYYFNCVLNWYLHVLLLGLLILIIKDDNSIAE